MKFSKTEKEHLLKAWLAISIAFAILMGNVLSFAFLLFFAISIVTVGIGFVLHELAHKFVAQRYGCWAEFRADDRMLLVAIGSAFLGFVFAAPGAVFIHGQVTKEKSGLISLAGPAANMLLAVFYLILGFFLSVPYIVQLVLLYGFKINSFIALFNLIPFMNFDGAKILQWSKPVYAVTVIAAALLFILPSYGFFL